MSSDTKRPDTKGPRRHKPNMTAGEAAHDRKYQNVRANLRGREAKLANLRGWEAKIARGRLVPFDVPVTAVGPHDGSVSAGGSTDLVPHDGSASAGPLVPMADFAREVAALVTAGLAPSQQHPPAVDEALVVRQDLDLAGRQMGVMALQAEHEQTYAARHLALVGQESAVRAEQLRLEKMLQALDLTNAARIREAEATATKAEEEAAAAREARLLAIEAAQRAAGFEAEDAAAKLRASEAAQRAADREAEAAAAAKDAAQRRADALTEAETQKILAQVAAAQAAERRAAEDHMAAARKREADAKIAEALDADKLAKIAHDANLRAAELERVTLFNADAAKKREHAAKKRELELCLLQLKVDAGAPAGGGGAAAQPPTPMVGDRPAGWSERFVPQPPPPHAVAEEMAEADSDGSVGSSGSSGSSGFGPVARPRDTSLGMFALAGEIAARAKQMAARRRRQP